jgi:hypothetical protein
MTNDMAGDQRPDVPDAADLVEMAETVTLLHSGLDAVGRCLEQQNVSDAARAASRCADDPDFTAAWWRASRQARIETLTTMASLTAPTMPSSQATTEAGASIGCVPLDGLPGSLVNSAAGGLVACAVQERRVPLPMSGPGLFGPLTGPTAAAAAGPVRNGGIGERDQRVVFAALGPHYLTSDINPPVRGSHAP